MADVDTNPDESYLLALESMERAVWALRYEVPDAVWQDFNARWETLKKLLS
jgi:hypothetical protein